jgi:hypothetical protein
MTSEQNLQQQEAIRRFKKGNHLDKFERDHFIPRKRDQQEEEQQNEDEKDFSSSASSSETNGSSLLVLPMLISFRYRRSSSVIFK